MKKYQIIALFLVYLVILIPLSSYIASAQDTMPPSISELDVVGITATTATILWETDEDATSRVYYGETDSYGLEKSLPGYSKFHFITLTGLSDGILYFYQVESCDVEDNCNTEEGNFAAGSDVVPPFLELDIPAYHNSDDIRLVGKTEPYTEIKLYLNEVYKGFISSTTTGAQGIIDFLLTGLQIGSNTIRVNAEDSSGNAFEQVYSLNVDVNPPYYIIDPIPETSSTNRITISGSVSEQVTINFYISSKDDTTAPLKVTGLIEESVDTNSVSFSWDQNQENDLDFYAIYRDDVRITTYSDNQFTDINLNTDTSYIYSVSAVDTSCNEGEKSDPLTLHTLSGGSIISTTVDPIALPCEEETPVATIETSNTFSQEINLMEGNNLITIEIIDLAGNTITEEATVLFDSKAPQFEYTNIDNPKILSPSYIRDITIKGKVDEPATIFVFMNDDDVPEFDRNTPVTEAYVINICDGKSSYKGKTDENGEFSIDVELKRDAYLAYSETGKIKGESTDSWKNSITVMAVDRVGLTATAGPTDIIYTICGYGSDWDVDLAPLDRDVLIPRLILDGVEQFGLYYTLRWQGPGDVDTGNINNIELKKERPLNQEELQNYDIQWVRSTTTEHSADYSSAYSIVRIQAVPEPIGETTLQKENNISDHRKGECLLGGYGCIKLPLMLEIQYTYLDPYDNTIVSKTQMQCWDTEIAIDRRVPSDKIPKNFLKASIKLLNNTIKAIDAILPPIQTAYKYAFYGCFFSWFGYIAMKAGEFFSCFGVGGVPIGGHEKCNPEDSDPAKAEQCKSCLRARAKSEQVWVVLKWLCDRVMCPSAPTIHKYIRDVKATDAKSHCTVQDLSNINFEITKAELDECNKWHEDYSRVEVRDTTDEDWGAPIEECCEAEYVKEWDSASLLMNELEESYCLTLSDYTQKQPNTGDFAKPEIQCGGIKALTRVARGICVRQTNEPELLKVKDRYYVILTLENTGMRIAYEAETIEKGEIEKVNEHYKITNLDTFVKKSRKEILEENDCYKGDKAKPGVEPWTYDEAPIERNPNNENYVPEEVWDLVCIQAGEYVVDPTSDIFSAFESVCLSAMREYLEHWRNVLQITKNCFETILYTGDGSAGVCKQFLSVYLCDLIYWGIKCIMQKAEKGVGSETKKGIAGFLGYLSSSGRETQEKIAGRYGESNIYRAMFVERKLIHSLCLFAFTGDWGLDFESLIETEAKVPIKPTCVISGTRRYLSRDPQHTGYATFMYNIGAFILAGADDTSYEVQLVCSADNRCDTDYYENGRCDCFLYQPGEQVFRVRSGTLSQEENFNEEIYESIQKPYRFDRARIKVHYINNMGDPVDEICGEVNLLQIGGKPPADCGFDMFDFEYRCEFEWGQHGHAYFEPEPEPSQKDEYFLGQTFFLEGSVIKESVKDEEPEKMFIGFSLKRGGAEIYQKKYFALTEDGTYRLEKDIPGRKPFPGITFTEDADEEFELNPFLGYDSKDVVLKYEVSLHYADDSGSPMKQPISYKEIPQLYTGEIVVIKEEKKQKKCTPIPSKEALTSECLCGLDFDCGRNKNQYCCYKEDPYCKKTGKRCNDTAPIVSLDDEDMIIEYDGISYKRSNLDYYQWDRVYFKEVQYGDSIVFTAKKISDDDPGVYKVQLKIGNVILKETEEVYDWEESKLVSYKTTVNTKLLDEEDYWPIYLIATDRDGNKDEVETGLALKIKK